jgi:hypothetical protein
MVDLQASPESARARSQSAADSVVLEIIAWGRKAMTVARASS